jgi:nicotinate phosphoribosyltransferase
VTVEGASDPTAPASTSALLVDLYELTMAQSFFAEGMAERPATFSLFFRRLPDGWGYVLAAGLDDVLRYLEELAFTDDDLAYLHGTGLFTAAFLDFLRGLRFTGEVRALREGTALFPHEPALEVTARVVEAQLAETMVINHVNLQSLIAGKAARCVEAARGRTVVDFALRRAHGGEAGMKVARSTYLAGFDSTSNVLAGRRYGIPLSGTMAHSYVESFADESAAFHAFARSYPDASTLLVDTYDTIAGTRHAAEVARDLRDRGARLAAIRIDSGDLDDLSRRARDILDEEGFTNVGIFVSGGLDEHDLDALTSAGAPIDGFGVGTNVGVSADAPYLDMVYKLAEFDGRPRLKLSPGKATLPGRKQVWRVTSGESAAFDVIELEGAPGPEGGRPLLETVMADGRRTLAEPVSSIRERAARERQSLDPAQRALRASAYDVRVGPALGALRDRLSAEALPAREPR